MKKYKLLLTNDDGIEAGGIKTLWEGVKDHFEIAIAAPRGEQSGKGMSVTFYGPIRAQKSLEFGTTPAWKIEGTPADCVKLALGGLLDWTPDLIISGINHGSNAGRGILHSGTAGCVIQGTLLKVPGIAFSHTCGKAPFLVQIKSYLRPIIERILHSPLPKGTFLNVNFPKTSIRGVKMARQGLHFWYETLRKKKHSSGDLEFHLDETKQEHKEHPDSDIALLEQGFITAVPIHINEMTDHSHFQAQKADFDLHFQPQTNP